MDTQTLIVYILKILIMFNFGITQYTKNSIYKLNKKNYPMLNLKIPNYPTSYSNYLKNGMKPNRIHFF